MSIRITYFISLMTVCLLLGVSIYLQFFDGVMPCPLCALQRFTFVLLGVLFLLGLFIYKKRLLRLSIDCLALVTSIVGIVLAGRQIWLQHYPPLDSAECGVDVQYLLQVLPVNEALQKIFEGTAECTQRGWEFLSLNMAEWSLLWFSVFTGIILYLFIKEVT